MSIQQAYKFDECRKTAKNLLTSVSRLVDEAGRLADKAERRELYLKAMSMSDEAYRLLGKARRSDENGIPAEKRFGKAKRTVSARG
jgi:hypothetical protein